jgi:hypothetical protein
VRGFVKPAEEAQRQVGSAIASGQRLGGTGPTAAMTDPQFAAAQAGGQPVMNLERGGEPARNAVRWAANTSPEARQTLNEALDNRYYTQGNRLVDYLRTLFNFPNAYAQQKALADVGKLSNKALYDAAMAQGTGPIVSPELERLVGSDDVTSALQRAVKIQGSENVAQGYGAMSPRIQITPDGRIMFGGKPIGQPTAGMPMSGTGGMLAYPDLQLWDLTRQQLSGSATQAFRSGDNAAGRRLSSLAQQLNDALDTHPQATGYAAARGNAAQIFGAQDALEAGQQAVHTKMGNDELRDAVARLNPLERQLFQDGYASELINRIREMPDRTDIVNQIANTPAVRERNAIALGQDRANQIEAWLRVENIMNQGRRAVQGNSSTAAQLMSSALWGAGGSFLETGNPFDPGVFLRDAFLRHGFRQSVNMARNAANQRIANQMVTLLTSQDPNAIRMGMAMAARPVWLDALRRTDTGLARSGAVQMQ